MEITTSKHSKSSARRPLPASIAARLRTNAPFAVVDAGLVCLVYLLALVFRYDGRVPHGSWERFRQAILVIVCIHIVANYIFGLYGRVWRYASVQEARRILGAGVVAGIAVFSADLVDARRIPLSVAVVGSLLSLGAFGAVRFQTRLFGLRRREVGSRGSTRVLVAGAGDLGASIVRDILSDPSCGLEPVAFIDDDPKKQRRFIHGVPVLGTLAAIDDVIRGYRVREVLVALPGAPAAVNRDIADTCELLDVPVRIVPSLDEVVGSRPRVRDIRDLRIEDLMGRPPVETDLASVQAMLHGKRVMVTGAGGSIGSEIVRQVAKFRPEALLLLDHDETHLHDIATELDVEGIEVTPLLADIRDDKRIDLLMTRTAPEVIFHAAAHKHVPILEENPAEAIKTNVIGTLNVAEAAMRSGVHRFILISTDKAIRPVSVMGATKKIAEQTIRSFAGRADTIFSAVRFGNVLGSRGSVIPTFMRQISHGGPVTVTHPEMTRYFMSISEAVQLVLQAATLAEGGDVFTLDMGEPMNILSLAKRMIRLSGHIPDRDVPIVFTGVRPGERLNETVVSPSETALPSSHPMIVRSYPPAPSPSRLRVAVLALSRLADGNAGNALRERLAELAAEEPDVVIDLTPSEVALA